MTAKARNNQEIYDNAAAQWWSDDLRWVRTLKNLVPARLKFFDRHVDWSGRSVLDLGCAGGFMAEAIAQRGATVTGIDPAKETIAAARAHAGQSGLAIRYDTGTGEALPYDDATFDDVVCVDVLEHVSDLQQVLHEVARVLKPGGLFLFDTINRNFIARLATITVAEDILGLLPKGTQDPALFIKPGELRTGLQNAGMTPGRMAGLGPTGLTRRLDEAMTARQGEKRRKLDALMRLHETLGYRETLRRGYAVVRGDGHLVTTKAAAEGATGLEIEFADGTLKLGGRSSPRKSAKPEPPEQGSLF